MHSSLDIMHAMWHNMYALQIREHAFVIKVY